MSAYQPPKRSISCPLHFRDNMDPFSQPWEASPDCVMMIPSPGYLKRRSRQQAKGKKQVSFQEKPSILFQRDILTEELQYGDTWYTQSDIEGFYLDKRKTLKAFRKSKGDMTLIEDPDNYCIRGLEGYQSSKMLRVLRTQRASLISSILEEQDKQRIFNVNDPQGFMQISYHQSKRAVDRALQLAAFDEAFAVSDCKVEQWPDRSSPRPSGVSDIALLTKNLLKVFHVSESSRAA